MGSKKIFSNALNIKINGYYVQKSLSIETNLLSLSSFIYWVKKGNNYCGKNDNIRDRKKQRTKKRKGN